MNLTHAIFLGCVLVAGCGSVTATPLAGSDAGGAAGELEAGSDAGGAAGAMMHDAAPDVAGDVEHVQDAAPEHAADVPVTLPACPAFSIAEDCKHGGNVAGKHYDYCYVCADQRTGADVAACDNNNAACVRSCAACPAM
jgi:hypothetical protein